MSARRPTAAKRWEAAIASAREHYFTRARWEHFKERSREWQEINQHRDFLERARATLDHYKDDDRDAIIRQLDEAERNIERQDPIRHPELLAANIPEPAPEDLKPFLDGWSPHGPDATFR